MFIYFIHNVVDYLRQRVHVFTGGSGVKPERSFLYVQPLDCRKWTLTTGEQVEVGLWSSLTVSGWSDTSPSPTVPEFRFPSPSCPQDRTRGKGEERRKVWVQSQIGSGSLVSDNRNIFPRTSHYDSVEGRDLTTSEAIYVQICTHTSTVKNHLSTGDLSSESREEPGHGTGPSQAGPS